MICYRDGIQTDTFPADGGNRLIFGNFLSEPEIFSMFALPENAGTDWHTGHFESRDGYDCVMISEPRKSGALPGKTIFCLAKDLLVIGCDSDDRTAQLAGYLMDAAKKADNAMTAARLFDALTRNDAEMLRAFEQQIERLEETVVAGDAPKDLNRSIGAQRKKLMRCKRYYEQLLDILADMAENRNQLIGEPAVKRLRTLSDKFDRSYHNILNMQEYLTQVREEYQTQIDIRLNQTMKIFTVISAVFLPMTLLVGWYGMNFKMPEYNWDFGYALVILAGVLITGGCLYIFKKKKWF